MSGTEHVTLCSDTDYMAPTVEDVLVLTDAQVTAIDRAWKRVCGDHHYITGRQVAVKPLGESTGVVGASVLSGDQVGGGEIAEAFADLVNAARRRSPEYGFVSSIRWAYLASLTRSDLTEAQYLALTAGWRARALL